MWNMQRTNRVICYVAPDVPLNKPGGASVHVIEVASNLEKIGHKVHVISRRVTGKKIKAKFSIIPVNRFIVFGEKFDGNTSGHRETNSFLKLLYRFYLKTFFSIYVSLVVSSVIKKSKASIIIERETSFGAGALASILTSRPLYLEIVGPDYSRISASRSKAIFYYNEKMLREWVDRRKCIKVTAGVDRNIFYPDETIRKRKREEISVKEKEILVGYVGTFQKWHGVDTLISSFSWLRKQSTNIKCILVGPNYQEYRKISEGLGLKDILLFTGQVEYKDIPSYINACDIMVAPYNPNVDPLRKKFGIGWPIKILEYMACRKPVISTSVYPVTEIIEDKVSGRLVPPGNAIELSHAIAELAVDKELSSRIASTGYEKVASRYSWEKVAMNMSEEMQRRK
jgi:glycosyltransferase involved in cell wall biosynthesis